MFSSPFVPLNFVFQFFDWNWSVQIIARAVCFRAKKRFSITPASAIIAIDLKVLMRMTQEVSAVIIVSGNCFELKSIWIFATNICAFYVLHCRAPTVTATVFPRVSRCAALRIRFCNFNFNFMEINLKNNCNLYLPCSKITNVMHIVSLLSSILNYLARKRFFLARSCK